MTFLDLVANKECKINIKCHIFFYKVKTELILEIAGKNPYIFICNGGYSKVSLIVWKI
jgi:hypothetical protein